MHIANGVGQTWNDLPFHSLKTLLPREGGGESCTAPEIHP